MENSIKFCGFFFHQQSDLFLSLRYTGKTQNNKLSEYYIEKKRTNQPFPRIFKVSFSCKDIAPKVICMFSNQYVIRKYIYTLMKIYLLTRNHSFSLQISQEPKVKSFDRTLTLFERQLEYMENSSSNTWQDPSGIKKTKQNKKSRIYLGSHL